MKYGMNVLLWTAELNEGLLPVIESLKKMGYDGIEVPVFNVDLDYAAWGRRLDDLGLERTCVTVRNAHDDPMSPDAQIRQAGVEGLRRVLDCSAELGATRLVGPIHSAIGQFSGAGPTTDEWRRSVDSIRSVAEHAGQVDVLLGVECLNRFETYLLNSHADAARFVKEVGHPHCKMMFDTFHANIEEKCLGAAIRQCADVMGHIHISENDRGTPGEGHVPWDNVFDAIVDVGYDDWLVIEAFGLALPELAAATKIWRRMYQNEEQLARDGLAFMKRKIAERTKK